MKDEHSESAAELYADIDPVFATDTYQLTNRQLEKIKIEAFEAGAKHGRTSEKCSHGTYNDAYVISLKAQLEEAKAEAASADEDFHRMSALHDKQLKENDSLKADMDMLRLEIKVGQERELKLMKAKSAIEAEVKEQCRLNGMGQERELKLITEKNALQKRVSELEAALKTVHELLDTNGIGLPGEDLQHRVSDVVAQLAQAQARISEQDARIEKLGKVELAARDLVGVLARSGYLEDDEDSYIGRFGNTLRIRLKELEAEKGPKP